MVPARGPFSQSWLTCRHWERKYTWTDSLGDPGPALACLLFLPQRFLLALFNMVYGNENCKALYVGNLDPRVSEEMLQQIFSVISPVTSVKIIRDRNVSVWLGQVGHYSVEKRILCKPSFLDDNDWHRFLMKKGRQGEMYRNWCEREGDDRQGGKKRIGVPWSSWADLQ